MLKNAHIIRLHKFYRNCDAAPTWLCMQACQWLRNALILFLLFFSIQQRSMKGSLFTADMSQWLQKPLNVATLTAVQGHLSNDGVREKIGKMRQTGGDANLLRKWAHKLMKHFLDDYPQVQLVPFRHFSVFFTEKFMSLFMLN